MISDVALEQEIITHLVNSRESQLNALTQLSPEDFTDTDCRIIFEGIQKALKDGEEFTILSLAIDQKSAYRELNAQRIGSKITQQDFRLLKEVSLKRTYEKTANKVLGRLENGTLEEAKSIVSEFFSLQEKEAMQPMSTDDQNEFYLRLIEARKNPESGQAGYPYPFRAIQRVTLGAQRGEMVLIAARPSVGKSAMLENIAFFQSTKGFKTLFCSAEMDKSSLLDRQLARLMGVDSRELKQGRVEYDDLTKALDQRKNFVLWDTGSMTTLSIRSQIQKLKMTSGVDVVLIDYLQKLKGEGKTEYERVSKISSELKAIAMDCKIPVIVGCQYNRNAATQMPQLSDLRDSGNIEQDADVVISLWRDKELQRSEDGQKILTHVDILKNRNGSTFAEGYSLYFFEARTEFYEIN